jgi:hypothetical protein
MKARSKTLFKVKNEVILEESSDLYLNQIDEIKWQIALECEVNFDEIDVEKIEMPLDLSDDVDVSVDGLIFWKSLSFKPIQGIKCELIEGSDEWLDAINNGTIDKYINFFV